MQRNLTLRTLLKTFTGLTLLLSSAMVVQAQTSSAPALVNFQGRLAKPDGTPVPDSGTYSIRFSLWNQASGGTERWNQTIPNVNVKNGTFSVLLNIGADSETILNGNIWLEIKVGSDAPLSPRQQLVSVAYALKANTVPDGAITSPKLNNDAASLAKVSGGVLTSAGGKIGINIPNPLSPLHINSPNGLTIGTNGAAGGYTTLDLSLSAASNGYARLQAVKTSGSAWGNIILNPNGGNIGIGTVNPLSRLTVSGAIESLAGGFKFPDGTTQQTASVGLALPYANELTSSDEVFKLTNTGIGTTMRIRNTGGGFALTGFATGAGKGIIGSNDATGIGISGDSLSGYGVHGSSLNGFAGFFNGKVQVTGRTITGTLQITGGSDVAEPFNVREQEAVRPGMVVSIDAEKVGELRLANHAYDRAVAGIVSGANGINPGMTLTQTGTEADGKHPIAMTGRVWCYVDADANGPIVPGDLLTTSRTPGHAMRVTEHSKANGAVLGKAMSSLKSGKGLVLVLVGLQ